MSIYCDKLVHVQVVINCPYFVAQNIDAKINFVFLFFALLKIQYCVPYTVCVHNLKITNKECKMFSYLSIGTDSKPIVWE